MRKKQLKGSETVPRNGNKLEGKYKWGTKCNKIQLEKKCELYIPYWDRKRGRLHT